MKSTLMTFIGLLVVFFSHAAQLPDHDNFRCRSTYEEIDPSLSLAEQVRADLTSGLWLDESSGDFVQEMISFEPCGQAEWIRENDHQLYQKETATWSIIEQNSDLMLILRRPSRQPLFYSIAPNCEGIVLTNLESQEILSYTYVETKTAARLNDLRDGLIGKWENMLPQVKLQATGNPEIPTITLEGVRVIFDFKANGRFQKSIISKDDVSYQENGHWELSKDGKYIYLHCSDSENGPVIQAVKIKFFDLDELVLEQPLAVVGQSYCTDNQYFYFNKI